MTDVSAQVGAGGAMPPAEAASPAGQETVRVWDPLVRVFHWSLVVLFATAWLTADEVQWLHELAGYTIAGLLAVRVVWGFIGTKHARFGDFVYRPSEIVGYLIASARFRAKRHLGHNPAGGVMVIALIAVLAMTAGTGILMVPGSSATRTGWKRSTRCWPIRPYCSSLCMSPESRPAASGTTKT